MSWLMNSRLRMRLFGFKAGQVTLVHAAES